MAFRLLARGALLTAWIAASGCGRLSYDVGSSDPGRGMDARVDTAVDAAAATPIDSGPRFVDAGPEPVDAGPEPVDSGPVDSGMTTGCAVGELECGTLCLAGAVCCPGDVDPTGCGCSTPRACDADGSWQACSTCTPGATEPCTGCVGGGTRTCSGSCTWGVCTDGAGEPCGSCTDGAFYCLDALGSGWTCSGGRWSCSCACGGGGLTCC